MCSDAAHSTVVSHQRGVWAVSRTARAVTAASVEIFLPALRKHYMALTLIPPPSQVRLLPTTPSTLASLCRSSRTSSTLP